MNMTIISDTHPSTTNRSSPFARGATLAGRRIEHWKVLSPTNDTDLEKPLRWTKGRHTILTGDLFHENVPDEWIDRVFAVMALCPQHRFQVLTKRSKRMREYMTELLDSSRWLIWEHPTLDRPAFDAFSAVWEPLARNIWLGVSTEDQARADERIPDLLATPAAVRFVSAEPLLGSIDFANIERDPGCFINALDRIEAMQARGEGDGCDAILDWIIVGGESGPGARPMHPDWARSIRDQCRDAGVAFFMKQMDKKLPIPADLMVREMPTPGADRAMNERDEL